jgi:hypothetical protein
MDVDMHMHMEQGFMNVEHAKWAASRAGCGLLLKFQSTVSYRTYSRYRNTCYGSREIRSPPDYQLMSAAAPSSVCLEQSKTESE